MHRLALLAIILTAQGAFAASTTTKNVATTPEIASGRTPNVYPAEDRRLFVQYCTNGSPALHDFCVCAITEFQATMTFEEFGAMNELDDEQLRKHQPYVKAILKCVEKPI